jgi:hypothetical protein
MFPENFGVVGNLYGQLSRRRQRKQPGLAFLADLRLVRQQTLVGRYQEGRSLAGPCLCLAGNVVALQRDG